MIAPLFLAYGFVNEAYIGTEALATVVMHVSKLNAYGTSNLLYFQKVMARVYLEPQSFPFRDGR
jgi:hypothetical protein